MIQIQTEAAIRVIRARHAQDLREEALLNLLLAHELERMPASWFCSFAGLNPNCSICRRVETCQSRRLPSAL